MKPRQNNKCRNLTTNGEQDHLGGCLDQKRLQAVTRNLPKRTEEDGWGDGEDVHVGGMEEDMIYEVVLTTQEPSQNFPSRLSQHFGLETPLKKEVRLEHQKGSRKVSRRARIEGLVSHKMHGRRQRWGREKGRAVLVGTVLVCT